MPYQNTVIASALLLDLHRHNSITDHSPIKHNFTNCIQLESITQYRFLHPLKSHYVAPLNRRNHSSKPAIAPSLTLPGALRATATALSSRFFYHPIRPFSSYSIAIHV